MDRQTPRRSNPKRFGRSSCSRIAPPPSSTRSSKRCCLVRCYPSLVCLALAAFAPTEWPRFAIVEEPGGRCGLATRTGAARYFFAEQRRARKSRAARAFGDERVVWGGEAGGIPAAERIADGAARLAIAALEAHGVSFADRRSAPSCGLRSGTGPLTTSSTPPESSDPAEDSLARLVADRPALLVVDRNVMKLYGRAIRAYAAARLERCSFAQVRPGDATKTWSQVAYLCEQAQRAELPRHGVVVGIGGGVALDVAGMTAALYRRGVRYLRLPTTLLAMVDVAVGIKQAINFSGRKSLLGAFYPAVGAVNDLGLLRTLPRSRARQRLRRNHQARARPRSHPFRVGRAPRRAARAKRLPGPA